MKLYYSKCVCDLCIALCVDLSFKLIHTYNLHIIWKPTRNRSALLWSLFLNNENNKQQQQQSSDMNCGLAITFDAFMRECNSDKSHTLQNRYSESLSIASRLFSLSFSFYHCLSISTFHRLFIRWCIFFFCCCFSSFFLFASCLSLLILDCNSCVMAFALYWTRI